MADRRLIAAILLGGMMPTADLVTHDSKTKKLDPNKLMRMSMVGDVGLHAYPLILLGLIASDHNANLETKAMSESNGTNADATAPASDEGLEQAGTAFGFPLDDEIIAAIITAGMLPTLPVPKLHRVAHGWQNNELMPMAEIIMSALTLYRGMLGTMRQTNGAIPDTWDEN